MSPVTEGEVYERKPLKQTRYFSVENQDPFETRFGGGKLEWETRTAQIKDDKGQLRFEQHDVEVPKNWGQHPTNILASKYFYGDIAKVEERENSFRQVGGRIADFIADRGLERGYFASEEEARIFADELKVVFTNQLGFHNSPVIFNCGIWDKYKVESGSEGSYRHDFQTDTIIQLGENESYKYPQAAACFIKEITDDMQSLGKNVLDEMMLFKQGSGVGADLSEVRSTHEKLSGGGTPSGPLSFMKIFDRSAAVVKSGGKTRRAARMQSLGIWHPNIMDFIEAKSIEEKKAGILMRSGFSGGMDGDAYDTVAYQNTNLSVRVTDEFMEALKAGKRWQTRPIHNAELADEMPNYDAKELMYAIARGTKICGDPGMQYDTTINKWNTCNKRRINASNPCSEFMWWDNSACNLASLNLLKFVGEDGTFNVRGFEKAVELFILSQEILVDGSSYPSLEIALNSHESRPLGLGLTNIGATLMSLGMPYDSDEGRAFVSSVTSLMTGLAYNTSSKISKHQGPFKHYEANKDSMLGVMKMHQKATDDIDASKLSVKHKSIKEAAQQAWKLGIANGNQNGYRNAQVSLFAPTGTIGFMMEADTLGVEPDIALVKYKQLAGGGMMKIINQSVPRALRYLGYDNDDIRNITEHVEEKGTIEGAPGLKKEHLPIFDCSFRPENGERSIHYTGHIRMMAAAQPFLSGAISKTVNMPKGSTIEEIVDAYTLGHELGLKALAIFPDGAKNGAQPVTTGRGLESKVGADGRVKMPQTRWSIAHKFQIGLGDKAHEGYFHVGLYDNGKPGELFITTSKEGSTIGGFADAFATAVSLLLQEGNSIKSLAKKFKYMNFPPGGLCPPEKVQGMLDALIESPHECSSMVDYTFQWLQKAFPEKNDEKFIGNMPYIDVDALEEKKKNGNNAEEKEEEESKTEQRGDEGLVCPECGGPAKRVGRCDKKCIGKCKGFFPGECGGP